MTKTFEWSVRGFWGFYRTEWDSLGEALSYLYRQDHVMVVRKQIKCKCWQFGPFELIIRIDDGRTIPSREPRLAGYDQSWVERGF